MKTNLRFGQQRMYHLVALTLLVLFLDDCRSKPAVSSTVATATMPAGSVIPAADKPVNNADDALARLREGNERFVGAKPSYPHQSVARRNETAGGQKPFAIVLGCADSRVAPELVFDQGLGDLFVVRVAGNILDDDILGSLEFAVKEFNAPLIMVLGHEKCGAVSATLESIEHHAKPAEGKIPKLVAAIAPAIHHVQGKPGDELDNGVRENISLVVEQLKRANPLITKALKEGRLKIVGARYDLHSGAAEVITQ